MPRIGSLLLIFALALFCLPAGGQEAPVALEAAEPPTLKAGQELDLVIKLKLQKGLHINSNKPKDPAMIPTKLTATSGQGLSFNPVDYPKPKEYKTDFAPEPILVFNDGDEFLLKVKALPSATPGDYTVHLRLDYQACDDQMCMMPDYAVLGLSLKVE